MAATAARQSWLQHDAEVFLDDLGLDSPSYDGTEFAWEYRRPRQEAAGS